MKYSVTVKFIAVILCTFSLVTLAFSGIGIAFMEGYDLYHTPLETVQRERVDQIGSALAWHHAQVYAADTLSNAPAEVLEDMHYSQSAKHQYGKYSVTLYEDGEEVYHTGQMDERKGWEYTQMVQPNYPVVTGTYFVDENGVTTQTFSSVGVAAMARIEDQEPVCTEQYSSGYRYDEQSGNHYETVYSISYYQGPEYEVRVELAENVLLGADYMLVTVLYPYRQLFIPALLAALVVFAICIVFLCTVAGRTKNGEVKLAAINRIPLDLYGLCLAGLIVLMFLPLVWLFETAYYYSNVETIWDNPQLCLLICCLCGFGIGLCAIGFLYAFAAQVKASNNYWLRHTVVGWALRQMCRVVRWILCQLNWILKWLGRGFCMIGSSLKAAGRGVGAVFAMLPVIWQWLVTAAAMVICPLIFLLFVSVAWHDFWTFLWGVLLVGSVVADVAIVCYGGWCFGTLLKGIEVMSKGDLNHKIDTRFLYGTFKKFGEELNSLAEAAKLTAEKQMKSERMKTELITNVSHDIKTPLTSIINFVDLLKKPHSDAEGEEYLAVLDRQSQRLKKLIDDLMDMSKASSGNVSVELGSVDAAEAINQALGEFADKLDRVNLTPVFRHPEKTVTMMADGKHLWRVLSNLLNNAVKYAMPNTRLYIDLMELDGNAVIAIKNISREQLNVNAEELMERFVRGDASRNTEGSGLGLNIAKSLVELQGGQMHLMVDGDLFKVTLIFPQA